MPGKRLGIHEDIMMAITWEEADEVTPSMTKIYFRLIRAPEEWWQGNKILRVKSSSQEGVSTTAWAELVNWLGVTLEDAHKAIEWLNEKEIINYQSYYNGREIIITFEGLYYPEDDA
jgi:hypothetical protein